MKELLHNFLESKSTSVNGVTSRTRLTAATAADMSGGWRNRGRDVAMWEVERRTMGRDMLEVEMAGREENLLGAGVGVVGRFWCSVLALVGVELALAVSWQSTEADRPRLKNLLRFLLNRRFFEGVFGED